MMSSVAEMGRAAAEREHSPLVAELDQLRDLLESYRLGEPPPEHEPWQREPWQPEDFEPAVDRLARLLGLSSFERQVLLLAAGVELDGDLAALVSLLQDGNDMRPTFGLALAALPGAHWDALAPRSPLRRWRLVEPGPGPTLASRPLGLDERILHHLTGLDATDDRLDGVLRVASGSAPIAPSQHRLAEELARTAAAAGPRVVVRLDGEDTEARLGVAQELAAVFGRVALVLRAAALPPPGSDLASLTRLIDREALLLDGLPIVETDDGANAAIAGLLDQLAAPLVVLVGDSGARASGRIALHRSVELPAPSEQRLLWTVALGEPVARALEEPVEEVAQHFRLGAAAVDSIARELAATATLDTAAATLKRLCRERSRVRLEGLAERIDPAASWDDLVLPPAHSELLREIVRHVRHRAQVYERWGFAGPTARGLGVTALFAGESGTGKTLAAEVLAGELGLDLYRIDLAATVSKYIGETEKNLRRLFLAAEASGAVLLFDEADALFGKRGEVKDGHDRYANLEVAYLLQRMESYRGLAILTTNLRSNVDRAFLRRLRFVVQFPFPDPRERAEIWRRTFPTSAPLDGIDLGALAKLAVAGGSIKAIALSAAFAAAEGGGAITPAHVLRAARVEYAKAERTLTDSELEALR
jgi:ATP-dependent 26S proteasome regulatory subunit